MSERIESRRDTDLADALEDFHRRRGRGELPRIEDYRGRLGDSHSEFQAMVEAESALDDVLAPAVADALPRTFGPYTLLRELGRGAAGVVYEAVHRDLGRSVALKVLRTGFDTDATAMERFRREARACAHVRHDRIVAIYEFGELEDRPYYAMDLVPGETLAQRIRSKRLPSPEDLCTGLAGIADALEALHHAGIVHRDVKPSNVIVRPDGSMMLADFGLARSADAATLTRTGDALGTPLYMSPEQILGQRAEVDARTDVYGLGATLYEGLTGRPVFEVEDMAALMKAILTERPVPPRASKPSLPEACERIALKCLEKSKKDRYPTAAAVAADLRAFAAGRRVAGRPVGRVVRGLRIVRKQWIPIAAALLVAAGGAFWWTHRPATLHVQAGFPDAIAVSVEDERQGVAGRDPIEIAVGPGTKRVRFEADGMEPLEVPITFRAGGDVDRKPLLVPKPENAEGKKRFEDFLGGISLPDRAVAGVGGGTKHVQRDVSRSDTASISPLFPRGDVLESDLDRLYVEFDDGERLRIPTGRLVFRQAGREIYAKDAYEAPHRNVWLDVPAEVRAAARSGEEIAWGWEPEKGAAMPKRVVARTATFRLVATDPSKALARLGVLEHAVTIPNAHELLSIQALRKAGLETAAFRRAYAFAAKDPSEPRVWTPILELLSQWGAADTYYGDEVQAWVRRSFRGDLAPTLEPAAR
jgi:serine/threonine-protein kinase